MKVAIIIMGETGISVFEDGFGGDYWCAFKKLLRTFGAQSHRSR
jgi:hypothetical protein